MLNTKVNNINHLGADEVIIATGSEANRLPVSGFAHGIQAIDYLLGKRPVGDNVVIIGGGLTGCEIAYDLYLQGKHPTIVESPGVPALKCGDAIISINQKQVSSAKDVKDAIRFLFSGIYESYDFIMYSKTPFDIRDINFL